MVKGSLTRVPTPFNGEKTVFSTNGAGKLDIHMQKNVVGPLPYTIYKINSKWIKDLNVKLDTIKLLEENIGRTFFDINHSNIFLDTPPRVMEIKTKTNGT